MTSCRCEHVTHLAGHSGQDYARAHLTEVRVDADKWLVLHRCPATGRYWLEWFPDSGSHGGGIPEFRQVSAAEIPALFGEG